MCIRERDNKEYDSSCESQNERATKRWNASACQGMQTDANEKEKEKEKENITSPLTPVSYTHLTDCSRWGDFLFFGFFH